MGTIFVAGSYGVGKSTLCNALSKTLASLIAFGVHMTNLIDGLLANAMKKHISVAQMMEKYLVSCI